MKGYKESSEQLTYKEATTACSERTYFFASPLQALKNYGFINNGELKNFSEIETSNSDRDRTCDYRSYTDNVKLKKDCLLMSLSKSVLTGQKSVTPKKKQKRIVLTLKTSQHLWIRLPSLTTRLGFCSLILLVIFLKL